MTKKQSKIILLDQGLELVQKYITKIINIIEEQRTPQFCLEEYPLLYTTIFIMSTQKSPYNYAQQLYDKYREVFEDYIKSKVLPSLKEKHGENMLRELMKRWRNHKVMVYWLSNFFCYLDRYFVNNMGVLPLGKVGLTCFRDLVYEEMNRKVRDAIITLIDNEREGGIVDIKLMKNILDIFVEIGMGQIDRYENDFEEMMLKNTSSYYSRESSNWILEDSCPNYMLKVECSLQRENDRVANYLHSSSQPKLLEKVQHELLLVHATQLLEKQQSCCHALLKDVKVDDLSRMYMLFSKIPQGLESVLTNFKEHVTSEATALFIKIKDDASSKKVFVSRVIELLDKYMKYENECFQNDKLFQRALKEAFKIFCDTFVAGSSSTELLATFCDDLLKKRSSESVEDIEDTLEKVVMILPFKDKDLFAESCRKMLARRLLSDNVNEEQEKSFLRKLKQQYGNVVTSQMVGMVEDLTLSRENQASFVEFLSNNPNAPPRMDMKVTLLCKRFWPSYNNFDLNLPVELAKCVEFYRDFYNTKARQKKQLTFINNLGTCVVDGKFDKKTIELVMTTTQAAALLLFNNSERLCFQEVMTRLNIGNDDALNVLHSLSCGEYKILTKEPNSKTVTPSDIFHFNSGFSDEKKRIELHRPLVDEKKEIEDLEKYRQDEKKKENKEKDQDRRFVIGASIVRIMKSKKVLVYEQLVSACAEHLSHMFKPDIKAIENRIEWLITREYLERAKENRDMIKYVP